LMATGLRANLFWFNDDQWAKIKPVLPTNQPGPKRHEDRRILSGIMHVIKTGCRWVDCPPEYGPHKTIYNRFNRWSARGLWQRIFEMIEKKPEPARRAALDSTHIKVHRCAGGGKGGLSNRRSGSRGVAATPKFTRSSIDAAARGS
jgi:transposase